jgi:protein-S-isoprenylcysteine O-methyltransferase Ste14
MTATALAIYLVFTLLASVWRGWRQYRRTGDHGFRGFSGPVGSVAWFAGAFLTIGWFASLLTFLPDHWSGVPSLAVVLPAEVRVVGLALMTIAAAVALVAQWDMRDSWRVGVDKTETTELVTTGLFRWVRNPIFAAMAAVCLGLVLAVPNLIACVAFVATLIGIELQVRKVEEPYLLRVHGERYRAYARRVGRFVPGVGRLAPVSLEE